MSRYARTSRLARAGLGSLVALALGLLPALATTPAHASPPLSGVLFGRPGSPLGSIETVGVDGTGDAQLTQGSEPIASTDGAYVLFHKSPQASGASSTDIWVRNVATGDETDIFHNNDFAGVSYDITPDDSTVIFDYFCGIDEEPIVGGSATSFLQGSDCFDDAPSIDHHDYPGPDTIAFHNANAGIGLFNSDGTNRHFIPNTQPGDFYPVWSPDGQWIAFLRFGSGSIGNLYKIHPDGSGLTPLTDFSSSGPDTAYVHAEWTPDGNDIVFSGTVGGAGGIYAVPSDGSSGPSAVFVPSTGTTPEWVGSAPNLAVATSLAAAPVTVLQTVTGLKMTVSARLTAKSDGTPIGGQKIHFSVGSGALGGTCAANTNGDGSATCTMSLLKIVPGLLAGHYNAVFQGAGAFRRSTATGAVSLT